MPNGQEINYTYNNNNDNLEKISSTNGTDENYNELIYNLDHIVEMISVGTVYDFTYDGFGRPLKVLKNGIEYLEKEHISSTTQDVEKTTYGNGEKLITTYDKYGNVTNVKYGKTVNNNYTESVLEEFTYSDLYDETNTTKNSASKLTTHIDNSAGITYNYTYEDEKLKSVEQTKNGQRVLKITDSTEEERLVEKEYAYSDTDKLTYNFEYEKKNGVVIPDNKAVGVSVENTFNSTISYDDLGRVSGKNFLASGVERSTTYVYEDSTLPMDVPYPVERCTNYITSETDGTNTTSYTYDKNGNITRITTPSGVIQYSYDNLNRLQTEVNNVLGKTFNYTYDREGNILTKSTLNHSTNRTSSYTYGYDSNKLLTSYNGTPIAYDSLGNISSYYYSFSWEKGHLLKSLTDRMDFNVSFEYNAQGLRTRKNDQYNGKDHKYIYDGDKLVREIIVDSNNLQKVLNYYYDVSGICGFSYGGTNYFYKKNILGDILAIYNQSGTVVAEYAYDAFGNCTILSNTNDIANINPIRYRGYYYDTEFRLYYLKSRYYSPELGRFISPDSIDYLEPETINGLNLYAYCLNNPVMYADPTGHFVFITALLISMGIAAGIGATLAGISAYQSGERGWDLFADIIGGAIFGAAIGATIALGGAAGLAAVGGSVAGFGLSTGVALGISIGVTTIAGMTKYSLDCVNSSENNWNFGGFVLSGIESALQGIATFGLAYLGGKAGFFNKWGNFKGWYDFYLGYGGMNNLKMISYLSNLIIGPTLSKALFVSGSAALARWLIDLIIPDLY